MVATTTPKGAWRMTFLLFLFMLVNFADKIVVGLAGIFNFRNRGASERPSTPLGAGTEPRP